MKRIFTVLLITAFVLCGAYAQAQTIAYGAAPTAGNTASGTSVSTGSQAWPSGSTIVIVLTVNGSITALSCTVTGAGTPAQTSASAIAASSAIYSFMIWNASSATAAASCSWTTARAATIMAFYITGADTLQTPFDVFSSAFNVTTANPTCSALSPNVQNAFILSAIIENGTTITPTAGSGYTQPTNGTATAGTALRSSFEYKTVSTFGSQSPGWTATANASDAGVYCISFSQALSTAPSNTGAVITGTGASDSTTTGCTTGGAWSNPGNITADDSAYAVVSAVRTIVASVCLKGTNYGFAIPSTATITGVVASVKCNSTINGGAGGGSGTHQQLTKTGSALVGNDRLGNGQNCLSGTVDSTSTVGSQNDMWGVAIAPADVNASTFGFIIRASVDGGSVIGDSASANVNAFWLTIYYIPAAPALIPHRGPAYSMTDTPNDYHVAWLPDGRELRAQTGRAR